MASLLKVHQDLPAGVNPYPSRKGKKRFEMLQTFNLVLGGYILIHQLLVPLAVYFLQTGAQPRTVSLSFWYLYHLGLALFLWHRTPARAFSIVYLAWFGVGYLPLTLGATLFDEGLLRFKWKAVSGLLCYGSSFVFTLFLLYRMRMPTTAFLFGLEGRIIPRWRYAIPYAALGLTCSLFWVFCPIAKRISPPPEPPSKPAVDDVVRRRYQYE
jgi:hypothetical protein